MNLKSCYQLLRHGRLPGQLIIQLTDRCNAACPQCGMNIRERYPRKSLLLDDVRRMIDAAARQGVQALSFTGGEPLLERADLIALIRHAGAAGIPYIRTGTNGFCFRSPDKPDFEKRVHQLADELASTPLRNFWISIDSADPETHANMRGFRDVMRGIERALPIFHTRGLYPSANLGINRNMGGPGSIPYLAPTARGGLGVPEDIFRQCLQNALARFFRFAAEIGFSIANVCYPMSVDGGGGPGDLQAVYGATATSSIVAFTDREKALLFDALALSVAEHRSRLRIFTPLCSLLALKRQFNGGQKGYACRGGRDFFFVDAQKGHTYPCGYRGEEDLGVFGCEAAPSSSRGGDCHACEWECFRDPSELAGPLLEVAGNPFASLRRLRTDPVLFRRWVGDLRYYRDCDFFDGRRPARLERLKRHSTSAALPEKDPAAQSLSISSDPITTA